MLCEFRRAVARALVRSAKNLGTGPGRALRRRAASEGAGLWPAAAGRGALRVAPEIWKAQVGRRPAEKDSPSRGPPRRAGGVSAPGPAG